MKSSLMVDLERFPDHKKRKLTHDGQLNSKERHTNLPNRNGGDLSKRQDLRWITNCPNDGILIPPERTQFRGSECNYSYGSPQAYILYCSEPTAVSSTPVEGAPEANYYYGVCNTNELCIQFVQNNPSLWPQHQYNTAVCLTAAGYTQLILAYEDIRKRHMVQLIEQGQGFNDAEFLLTGQTDFQTMFFAEEFSVSAKDQENNTIGDPLVCEACGNLSWFGFPADAFSFEINVTVPNVGDIPTYQAFAW